MTALRRVTQAAVLLWWLPAIVLVFARPAAFQVGFRYRARRAHWLMEAGRLDEADRLIARLRADAERYRRRVEARFTASARSRNGRCAEE